MQGIKIKEVILVNFQGHRNTTLPIHENVSALVGKSGKGKSTILKAIEWVYNDTIMGESRYGTKIHSHAIVGTTAKGNVKFLDSTMVEVVFTNGISIKRYKGKENKYEIQKPGEELLTLTAAGKGPQEQVQEIFNFSSPNFSTQFEGIYLLFDSPGKIMEELNKITDLTLPSKILSKIRSESKRTKAKLDVIEEDIAIAKKDLEDYDQIPLLESKLDTLEKLNDEKTTLENLVLAGENIIVELKRIEFLFNSYKDLDKEEQMLYTLKNQEEVLTNYNKNIQDAESYLDDLKYIHTALEKYQNLDELESKLNDLLKQRETLDGMNLYLEDMLFIKDSIIQVIDQINKLPSDKHEKTLRDLLTMRCQMDDWELMINGMTSLLQELTDAFQKGAILDKEIEELEQSLVGVNCPTCNKPMDKGGVC